jgi:hypothetical protein
MNNNVYAFALKSTLDEIQSACPDVSNTFIFKDEKILAKGETTDENTADLTINAFDSITERANSLGSLETVTIQGANGRVSITCMNDFYLTTVLSKKADEKYVNTLTRVLIPTVVKLVEKIHPTSADDETLTVKPEPEEEEAAEEDAESAEDNENEPAEEEENATTEPTEEQETAEEEETPEVDDKPLLPEPPVTQLIIENLGGLLVPSDTVRIDKAVITQWNDLYGDKKIEEVDLETIVGKTTRCKFKPIKDSKHKEKGIIQMPEKIQLTLEVAKGELVMVKPAVE